MSNTLQVFLGFLKHDSSDLVCNLAQIIWLYTWKKKISSSLGQLFLFKYMWRWWCLDSFLISVFPSIRVLGILNEKCSHRLRHLNSQSSIVSTVQGGIGGRDLSGKYVIGDILPKWALLPVCVWKHKLLASCYCCHDGFLTLWSYKSGWTPLSFKCFSIMVFYPSNRKITKSELVYIILNLRVYRMQDILILFYYIHDITFSYYLGFVIFFAYWEHYCSLN